MEMSGKSKPIVMQDVRGRISVMEQQLTGFHRALDQSAQACLSKFVVDQGATANNSIRVIARIPHMPNKDRRTVSTCWNNQQGKACSFTNANPTAHAKWVVVESRPLRAGGQPVVRRILRHNVIEAWETILKTGCWKRCLPKW